MPDITKQLVLLIIKMREERLKILLDNEKHLAKGVDGNYESASDDEDDMNSDGSSEDEDAYQKNLLKLQKAKKAQI